MGRAQSGPRCTTRPPVTVNVRVPLGVDLILRYLVVIPDLHRIHHSAWEPETNSNLGAAFPVWDLIFGTFRATPRDGHEQMRLGLDEVRGRDAQRPLWLLGSGFRERPERQTAAVEAQQDRPTTHVRLGA